MDDQSDCAESYIEPSEIVDCLQRIRFCASSEAGMQQGIEMILQERYPNAFIREFVLSIQNRPDFFNPHNGIVIEVKWASSGGSSNRVAEQISRYATSPRVRSIIVCSPSRRALAALPKSVQGIFVHSAVLSTGI